MSMTIEKAIAELGGYIGVYDDIYDYELKELWPALELAVAALREKAEREKTPLTFGDQVRKMDDEKLAWQLASLFAGGMAGVMEGIGMKVDINTLLPMAYKKMLDEVKGPPKGQGGTP